MGEITEMVLDGILCELCGVFIGDAVGNPRKCITCRRQTQGERRKKKVKKENKSGNNL